MGGRVMFAYILILLLTGHAATDFAKTEKRIGFNTDQAIHVGCKVLWAAIFCTGARP